MRVMGWGSNTFERIRCCGCSGILGVVGSCRAVYHNGCGYTACMWLAGLVCCGWMGRLASCVSSKLFFGQPNSGMQGSMYAVLSLKSKLAITIALC
jgi:hypothetical protein